MHAARDDAVREALEDAEVDYVPLLHGVEALHDHLYGEPHTRTRHKPHAHARTYTQTQTRAQAQAQTRYTHTAP